MLVDAPKRLQVKPYSVCLRRIELFVPGEVLTSLFCQQQEQADNNVTCDAEDEDVLEGADKLIDLHHNGHAKGADDIAHGADQREDATEIAGAKDIHNQNGQGSASDDVHYVVHACCEDAKRRVAAAHHEHDKGEDGDSEPAQNGLRAAEPIASARRYNGQLRTTAITNIPP